MSQLVLYDLYNTIRNDRQWLSPGVEEYYLLLKLLQSGQYPIRNFNDMALLLETIWLKSHQQKDKFRALLETRRREMLMLVEEMQAELGGTMEELNEKKEEPGITPEAKKINQQKENQNNHQNTVNEKKEAALPDKTGSSGEEEVGGPSKHYGGTGFSLQKTATGSGSSLNIEAGAVPEMILPQIPYMFTNDYFPVKNRQLQQAWRSLKNRQEGGNTSEIHFEKTIEDVAMRGYFSSFQYQKQQINQAQLFIFIDQAESMVAVEGFGTELCATATESEVHKNFGPWFFYHVPRKDAASGDYELTNEDGTQKISLRKLFLPYNKNNIVVMIYSDAGALTGDNDEEKKSESIQFIRHLSRQTAYMAWINPAPENRWAGSVAHALANELPMFETSRSDLDNAMAVLKGKQISN